MKSLAWSLFFIFVFSWSSASAQGLSVDRLSEGVYAAVSGSSGSPFNGLFWVGDDYVAGVGNCLDAQTLGELTSAIAAVTDKPLRFCILAPVGVALSADAPPVSEVALIVEFRTWQKVQETHSPLPFSVLYFRDDLALELAGRPVELLASAKGDDLRIFLPQEAVLYLAAAKSPDCSRKVRLSPLPRRTAPWHKAEQGAKIIVPACGSLVNSR